MQPEFREGGKGLNNLLQFSIERAAPLKWQLRFQTGAHPTREGAFQKPAGLMTSNYANGARMTLQVQRG